MHHCLEIRLGAAHQAISGQGLVQQPFPARDILPSRKRLRRKCRCFIVGLHEKFGLFTACRQVGRHLVERAGERVDYKVAFGRSGGKIGQYILTNSWHTVIRPPRPDGTVVTNVMPIIIRVDLYGDGTVWTNGTARPVTPVDPEAKKKAEREAWERREAVIRAWEAANLPPDLAELRRKQREAARQAKEAKEAEEQ